MQRVSAFLPSWDKRSSNSGLVKPNTNGGGIFGWAARNSANSNKNNNNNINNSSSSSSSSSRNSNSFGITTNNLTHHHLVKSLSPINVAAANESKVQREAFWPSALDMESSKAARILKSFCSDGFMAPVDAETVLPAQGTTSTSTSTSTSSSTSVLASTSDSQTPFVMKKIPKRIIQNAAGIAVFSCMRSGLWMTGSGGSGILVARKSDGTWSPPSGIMLHTPTLSFIIGVDVYDCVLVVTNLAALESITRQRVVLGEDVSLNNGPSTTLISDDLELNWKHLDNTVLAYMKARGRQQTVNLQGCILTERCNENERFYGAELTQMDILAGNVARHVEETNALFEVIKLAEGRTDYDKAIVEMTAVEPAPSDAIIATPKPNPSPTRPLFGVVEADDPDPFGVLALEMAGLEIREAGSRLRPGSSQFDVKSHSHGSALSKLARHSMDTFVSKSNRASVRSSNTVKSQMTDIGTQTDADAAARQAPDTTPSPGQSEDGHHLASIDHHTDLKITKDVHHRPAVNPTSLNCISLRHSTSSLHPEPPAIPPRIRPVSSSALPSSALNLVEAKAKLPLIPPLESLAVSSSASPPSAKVETKARIPADAVEDEQEYDTNDADDEDDVDESDEEPVFYEVAQVQPTRTRAVASTMIHAKGNVINIPKRIPPPLPVRSPARNSRCGKSDIGVENTMALSSIHQTFSEDDVRSGDVKAQGKGAERSSAVIEATKSASLGQSIHSDIAGKPKADNEPYQQTRTNESFQDTPSIIHAVLRPDNVRTQDASFSASIIPAVPSSMDVRVSLSASIRSSEDADPKQTLNTEAESQYYSTDDQVTDDDEAFKPLQEPLDNSDSTTASKKHTSSIYTGLTEDRWSIDRSSLTTPTSERPMSVSEYTTEENTPKKMSKEEEFVLEKSTHIEAFDQPLEMTPETPVASTWDRVSMIDRMHITTNS